MCRIQDIFEGKNHHPYTEGLFGSIPNLKSKAKRLNAIPGLMPDPTDLPEGCVFAERCKYAIRLFGGKHPCEPNGDAKRYRSLLP